MEANLHLRAYRVRIHLTETAGVYLTFILFKQTHFLAIVMQTTKWKWNKTKVCTNKTHIGFIRCEYVKSCVDERSKACVRVCARSFSRSEWMSVLSNEIQLTGTYECMAANQLPFEMKSKMNITLVVSGSKPNPFDIVFTGAHSAQNISKIQSKYL